MLETGARLWNGAIVTPALAAAYNSLQARIASFVDAGRPVPEHLLNGAHNLIACAPGDEGNAIQRLRAIDVPGLSAAAIYDMRDVIAGLITTARADIRAACDDIGTRPRALTERQYVDSVALRLVSVVHPGAGA